MFAGIDVGKKSCRLAVIDEKIIYVGNYEKRKLSGVVAVGIDAPLSLPEKGTLRKSEKELLNLGIHLFPSGARFFMDIAIKGMEIAEELRKNGLKVFEVYPYATRVLMGIAPKAKKRTKDGLREIRSALSKYIEVQELGHDDIDAVISALTVREYMRGKGFLLHGEIVLPKGINIETLRMNK